MSCTTVDLNRQDPTSITQVHVIPHLPHTPVKTAHHQVPRAGINDHLPWALESNSKYTSLSSVPLQPSLVPSSIPKPVLFADGAASALLYMLDIVSMMGWGNVLGDGVDIRNRLSGLCYMGLGWLSFGFWRRRRYIPEGVLAHSFVGVLFLLSVVSWCWCYSVSRCSV